MALFDRSDGIEPESLLVLFESVVLCDEVSGTGVQTHTDNGTNEQIEQRLQAEDPENQKIEGDLKKRKV